MESPAKCQVPGIKQQTRPAQLLPPRLYDPAMKADKQMSGACIDRSKLQWGKFRSLEEGTPTKTEGQGKDPRAADAWLETLRPERSQVIMEGEGRACSRQRDHRGQKPQARKHATLTHRSSDSAEGEPE